jgi:hypothetical protein
MYFPNFEIKNLLMLLFWIIIILSPLISLTAGIYSFKYLDKNLKIIFFYTVAGFFTEILNWLLVKAGIRNNMPGLHFYIMFEFLVWAVFYMHNLKGFINRRYILALIILFETYCIINFLFIQDLNSYPFTRTIENILLFLLSILFFTKIMVDAKVKSLMLSPLIWINTSVLIYFAGNFFYNVAFAYLLKADRIFLRTTGLYIFALFNFLYYAGIAAGFLVQRINSTGNLNVFKKNLILPNFPNLSNT